MQSDDNNWTAKVEQILNGLAKRDTTITYAEIAALAMIPLPHRIDKLTRYLETTIGEAVRERKPIIAALVVSKRGTGLPADGFFDCCARHGRAPRADESRAEFFHRLRDEINQSFS